MKNLFRILAVLSFLAVFGSVGALELGNIGLGAGTIQAFSFLTACIIFSWLGGGFDHIVS